MRTTTITAVLAGAVLALAGCTVPVEEPTAVQPAEAETGKGSGSAKPKKKVTVKITAKRAKAKASVLSAGQALSCVKVTVTNQRTKNLEVNPLYFSLVDTGGEKHETSDALGEYEGQIDTTTLAPGEKASGLVCARGTFKPKVVAMDNELLSEQARAEVAS